MYKEVLGGVNQASVPGTFIVDVLPLRESSQLSMNHGRELTDNGLPQSNIYLRGFPVCSSIRMQANLRKNRTPPILALWNMLRNDLELRNSKQLSDSTCLSLRTVRW